jgi:hypothetical protein
MKPLSKYTLAELEPFAKEWLRRRRAMQPSRRKVEHQCPFCQLPFGARELRAHQPQCKTAHAKETSK